MADAVNWDAINAMVAAGYKANQDGSITRPDGSRQEAPAQSKQAKAKKRNFKKEARLLFPWLPQELVGVFAKSWERYGDTSLAMAEIRQDTRYDQYFPGNRREDGSVIADEAEYLSTMEGYDRRLSMFGLSPADFQAEKIQSLQNGRSPDEMESDLATVQVSVLQQAADVRAAYAAYGYSADISDAAILASRLKGGVSAQEFEQRYRTAQIGGAATSNGFTYGRGQAERLAQLGVDQEGARQLFSQAASELPTLRDLMARHDDPEDDFTLDEYSDAILLRDPEHLQAISRVLTRERSLYSTGGPLSADRAGGITGLRSR